MTNEEFQSLVLKQLQVLAEGQNKLAYEVKNIAEEQKNLSEGQKNFTEEQREIRKVFTKLEARIESEIIDKIRALFDDRSVNQDYFASIKDSLARIEDRVEFLARQNIEHLDKLQKHDRELRLLRVEKQ